MTTINDAVTAELREQSAHTEKTSAPRKALGLYLHIPFCIRKCNYCDFLSFGGISEEVQKAYFRSMIREIRHYGERYSNKYYVDSIFIGGGTPSLVDQHLISSLMTAVRVSFFIDPNAEISIESNPKTLTKAKLNAYLDSGVNRLSIGAQSFDDRLLNDLGRIHTTRDFLKNYFVARECGFRNMNIDLMFAIPGQSMGGWMDTLEKAIDLAPEHISFYSLQIEEGTPFFTMFQEGSLRETDEELDRKMYHETVHTLKDSGYEHYEISNGAKKGYQCRHNLKYWSLDDYLGVGLGAHSYLEGARFSNLTDLNAYIQAVDEEVRTGSEMQAPGCGSPFVRWYHKNTMEDDISEYLFTGMRKMQGISMAEFEKRFGVNLNSLYGAVLKKYEELGLIEFSDDRLRFTVKGIDISNTILAEFI